jgi:peptidyl-prolyl cis-trans isomerase SurA
VIKKIKLLILILLIFVSSSNINSKANIKILYKVNSEIITNVDVENEIKYLIALNNQLNTLGKKQIIAIAKDSILKEKIKKIELLKYFDLNQKNPYLDKVVESFYLKLGMENVEQFKKYLSNYNLTIEKLKKKIEIETTWNQLIYDKYKRQINIDMKALEKIANKSAMSKKNKAYLLSEIIFEKSTNESFSETIQKIEKNINEIGFKNTANTFSLSDSAKFGGNIGWVEEINLSKKIIKDIKNLKIGEITKPISIGKNFIILKLEDTKESKTLIKKEVLLKKLRLSEEDRQLNKFSNIYFNKVKINTYINAF